jgi:hypothetical protein
VLETINYAKKLTRNLRCVCIASGNASGHDLDPVQVRGGLGPVSDTGAGHDVTHCLNVKIINKYDCQISKDHLDMTLFKV